MKKNWPVLLFLFITCSCHSDAGKNSTPRESRVYADKVVNKYYSLHDGFTSPNDVWGNYTLDLTFEAMLTYGETSDKKAFVDSVMKIMNLRNISASDTVSYHSQPFGCLTYALFSATGDSSYLPGFLHETDKMMEHSEFSEEGGVLHSYKGKMGLLIDYVQEYASRIAKAGAVSGNEMYFEKAVRQFEIYDSLVRHPATGLYSQGRGFLKDPDKLSPHSWSRGQGWILRGMVSTMTYLHEESTYMKRMQKILTPFVDSLILRQGPTGLWHQLVDLPFEYSYPETSGTGFIAYYLALAIAHDLIPKEPYQHIVDKAIAGIKNQISADGSIQGGCPGPGPILSIEKYYKTPGIVNEPHIFATTLYALAAEKLMHKTD